MAGRRPKPTQLKIIEGNPGKRPLNKQEPKPQSGYPEPLNLSKKARELWDELCPILDSMGVLTVADGVALERLCECYAEVEALSEYIKKRGRVFKTTNTAGDATIKANPAAAMLADADRRLKSYLVEFGLTPAARSKVHIQDNEENQNAAAAFFR